RSATRRVSGTGASTSGSTIRRNRRCCCKGGASTRTQTLAGGMSLWVVMSTAMMMCWNLQGEKFKRSWASPSIPRLLRRLASSPLKPEGPGIRIGSSQAGVVHMVGIPVRLKHVAIYPWRGRLENLHLDPSEVLAADWMP
ncbi:hypothetical protein FOZ62_022442, partial [Perkinsus olseni]